jgi:copper chaperone
MKTYIFKTNINCEGCISKVTPDLNQEERIMDWKVDTSAKDKILTVNTSGISETEIIEMIQKNGFKIEPLL